MSEIRPAVGMLYGPWQPVTGLSHPFHDEIFRHLGEFQASMAEAGLNWEIAYALQAPSGGDKVPRALVMRDPVYDDSSADHSILVGGTFEEGDVSEWAGVIDHWVFNFQDEIPQPDGTTQRTAHGIGVDVDRAWNHWLIQRFGNHKDLMDTVLHDHGVGIPTYPVTAYEQFVDEHPDSSAIYKPQGGSACKGIVVYDRMSDLRWDLAQGNISTNGFLQPYLDTMTPPRGLKFATKKDAEKFQAITQEPRPYEIRMHVITSTNSQGQLQTEAFPVLKVSEPHRRTMRTVGHIALDPESTPEGGFMHSKSVELAQAVCRAAGVDGSPVPQYYGVFDFFALEGVLNVPELNRVGDGNCRGPGLPVEAWLARAAFIEAITASATRQLEPVRLQAVS